MTPCEKIKNIYALLNLFGERYIHVDQEQAEFDVKYGREQMIDAFAAIVAAVRFCDISNDNMQASTHLNDLP